LKEYYSQTTFPKGLLYNLGAVLNPTFKMDIYRGEEWGPEFYIQYQREFLLFYKENYQGWEVPG
jgi:hypothetical protein